MPFDESGVIVKDYGGELGCRYNPGDIASYAIHCFEQYQTTSDQKWLDSFNAQIGWLLDNYTLFGNDKVGYCYDFDFPIYSLSSGWISALTQGEALSALSLAYSINPDDKILSLMKKICALMLTPVKEGGTLAYTLEGHVWLEEYPTEDRPSLVWNGFITAVFGLKRYVDLFPDDTEVTNIYEKCLLAVRETHAIYEKDNWLLYDRYQKGAFINNRYMSFQIKQMRQLAEITADEYYDNVADRWTLFVELKKKESQFFLTQLEQKLIATITEDDSVALYGAGIHTEQLLKVLPERIIKNIEYVVDRSIYVQLEGYEVYQPDHIVTNPPDAVIISSFHYQNEIYDYLVDELQYQGKIITLYTNQKHPLHFYLDSEDAV